jgi:protein phosphatase-4 regulatory subunit 3
MNIPCPTANPRHLDATQAGLIQLVTELLATAIPQHGHRVQYFILSNPTASRVASLAYMKQKPLKHGKPQQYRSLIDPSAESLFLSAAIRFFKACIKANNHFLHRHLIKNELLLPLIEMLEIEGPRDNMLCSSCLDVFELIRKVS